MICNVLRSKSPSSPSRKKTLIRQKKTCELYVAVHCREAGLVFAGAKPNGNAGSKMSNNEKIVEKTASRMRYLIAWMHEVPVIPLRSRDA